MSASAVERGLAIGDRGSVHLSLAPSPHENSTSATSPSASTMTQNEKSASPLKSVSNRAHPSSVLAPDVAVSSQPHCTLMLSAPGTP